MRRGWSVRVAGLLLVVGMAGFVAAQAVGKTPARGEASTATSATGTTTLPAPDPPPVTKPKAVRRPSRALRHVQKTPASPRRTVSRPAARSQPTSSTPSYAQSPPPPPAVQTVAPKQPAAPQHKVARRRARVVHTTPHRVARYRPRPLEVGVLARQAAPARPNVVATIAPAGPLGKGWARAIIFSLLVAPLLLVVAAALPARRLPSRVAGAVVHRRSDLAIGGLVGFGSLLLAWLVIIVLARLASGGP
jgi:hypothetical protein